MAYRVAIKENARKMYVVEGKSIDEISKLMGLPHKTVWNWKWKMDWDKDLKDGGNISLYMNMQKQFAAAVELAIAQDRLADPSTADALYKTAKLMDRLMPERVLLSNIFKFLEDLTNFFVANVESPEFMDTFQLILPKLADYLRSKYTSE